MKDMEKIIIIVCLQQCTPYHDRSLFFYLLLCDNCLMVSIYSRLEVGGAKSQWASYQTPCNVNSTSECIRVWLVKSVETHYKVVKRGKQLIRDFVKGQHKQQLVKPEIPWCIAVQRGWSCLSEWKMNFITVWFYSFQIVWEFDIRHENESKIWTLIGLKIVGFECLAYYDPAGFSKFAYHWKRDNKLQA